MSCKYDIIDEDGRKRVRALRSFTVQGRDVCPMELGGYVYDANTLSQDGNCWIFSGSLEYPGVRVMDEAIVDMGIDLPKSSARPKATIISGNSRIMGAISFETGVSEIAQTPAMFEQGTYNAVVGNVPVKVNASNRVRIPVQVFGGTVEKVAITSTAYEARLISLNEAGIVVSATAWTVGGPAVTLTSTAPYILVDVRKVGETAIAPADVTAAGITITQARGTSVRIFNSSIVSVYNGSVASANNIFRFIIAGALAPATKSVIQNSYIRTECVFNKPNTFLANVDFIKVNYNLTLTGGINHHLTGVFRNANMNSPASVPDAVYAMRLFDVSDCPNFEFSTVTFPDLAAMIASGKTFYFKNCNMPAGSAIHYYDPKVNVWDNIDFTKAMADLGKKAFADTTIISSNVQGMYRARGNTSGSIGGLLEAASSFDNATYSGTAGATYDCITYKDCVVKGKFTLNGRCVFGGTQGGAVRITNTKAEAMVVDGSFRIDGNAQVTDTPLKGTGYIGGNAELKNSAVEGYIYMDGNAKYIPAAVTNVPLIRHLIMRDNAQVLKQIDQAGMFINMELYDNAVMDSRAYTLRGKLIMRENASTYGTGVNSNPVIDGVLEMSGNSRIAGVLNAFGDIKTVGKFLLASGNNMVTGKRTLSDVSQIGIYELPQMKETW